MLRCEGCGVEGPALKTVRWRTGERKFVLCDGCWEAVSEYVWIVPGLVPCFGTCKGCSAWFPVGELAEPALGGGRWGAPSGLCEGCVSDRVPKTTGSDPQRGTG